jgi:non-specific serine/threonine protein kinase
MSEKNWDKIKDLFHEALRRNTGERAAFLDEACKDDIDLRIEVESLLLSLNEAKSFLEMPVIGERTETKAEWHLESGLQISHYRILEPIGSGGMSEVYLAHDDKLGRDVALKILPRDMLNDKSRLRRFEREANAVSALNHPNILTIFEFEQENGVQFFASEYVKGVTLRQRLESGAISVVNALEIAIQIASALQAAHEAGVVHRDIKPENVMIREDGYVKVLDFGLAKLSEKVTSVESAKTLSKRFSLPGVIMGTVTYMSPEQARGSRIDARSDIFSLGIVLYEMLTGRPPFGGATTADVLAEIIQTEPPRASTLNLDVPFELDDVVKKALEKNPLDRFQSVTDLLSELKGSLKRLEFNLELERTADQTDAFDERHAQTTRSRPEPTLSRPYQSDDISPLIGREKEIEELTDVVVSRRARLVTLTGTGGTGKTRLAREMCRRLETEFKDGFVFVRLGEVQDSSLIATAVAQQLHIREMVGTPIAESLKDHLHDRQLLLVLDNFEQIMDAAPFVAELLSTANELTILLTSRERLNLQAEIEFNVPPLAIPDDDSSLALDYLLTFDSVRLFVERSRQANPEFQLTNENASQIVKICSMLDGLPLAIELAAARTRIFAPATILEKLEARLSFLTGGARDLPERQQTMRAAVDWSYDLLNEDEKKLFRRLSVFACRFTPAAAETVAWDDTYGSSSADSVEFPDLFASLADKNLLIRRKSSQGDAMYGLLEIVREYAESVLETDDDEDEVRRRHAEFYLRLAEGAEPHLQSRESAKWIGRLEQEHDNLAAALQWSVRKAPDIAARLAAAIRQFWIIRGHLSEGIGWIEEILRQGIESDPSIRWKLLTACGNIRQFQGEIEAAQKFYGDGLAAARESGNQRYISQSLRGLGALAYIKYEFHNARNYLDEALIISRKVGDDFGRAAALARLGDISSVEGDTTTARDLTAEALSVFRRLGYLEGISAKLYNLGAIVYLDGDSETAYEHFKEAYRTALELGEKINTRLIFDGFAALAAERGQYSRAARLSGAADSLGATIGYAIEPAEQIFRDAYLGKLRAAMTDSAFDKEYKVGRKMTPLQASEFARPQLLDGPDRTTSEIVVPETGSKRTTTELSENSDLAGKFLLRRPALISFVILATLLVATLVYGLWMWFVRP